MGNKILIILYIPLLLIASTSYPDIDRLIEKVKVRREGLSQEEIKQLKDPFIDEQKLKKIVIKHKIKKIKKKKIYLHLQSIFNNKVKINTKWYKLGAKIGNYRIIRIDYKHQSVLLRSNKKLLRLFLAKRKKKRFKLIKM